MPSYVIYQEEPPKAGVTLCEIWKGLPPDLQFEEVKTAEGPIALRHEERGGSYVWIPPEVAEALKKNRRQVITVIGTRTGPKLDKLNMFYAWIGKVSEEVQRFNAASLQKPADPEEK
jgi:hypothetical protein